MVVFAACMLVYDAFVFLLSIKIIVKKGGQNSKDKIAQKDVLPGAREYYASPAYH